MMKTAEERARELAEDDRSGGFPTMGAFENAIARELKAYARNHRQRIHDAVRDACSDMADACVYDKALSAILNTPLPGE